MNVKTLVARLQQHDPEMEVVIQYWISEEGGEYIDERDLDEVSMSDETTYGHARKTVVVLS